ncbi:MAG TPA: class I SAM-dependent methyltransferase [Spirochaetota bacterium]|nr:class I SAM-dependent methyltransferase [Spirochaetota bacterium]HNT09568.1 class I SAM-dependent methyltransferase [Spirochaetota bacterium]HNV45612.1 class I SAM-dependent methyltransferase [Spirochaetota bacterium]HOS38955.1 class I SAM-dependent methyltransferase [Spirochaetota bacterium]HPI22911.1 class I SAM-dependent methyltransferase [Spirochaetota bacterium]
MPKRRKTADTGPGAATTEVYTEFARFYDTVLKHVDYDRWYRYIKSIMLLYVEHPNRLLELGCGTGRFGAKFSRDRYVIFGMDRSLEMLRVSRMRAYRNFRVLCGDMRQLPLAGTFDFIFSVHDTMNYFLEYDDIRRVLRSVRRAMADEGVFMFDITTEHNINRHFDNTVMRHSVRGTEIEWRNYFDRDTRLVYSVLDFRDRRGVVRTEKHVQRIYETDEILTLLEEEGFMTLDVFSDYSFEPVSTTTVMTNFVTRKK